MTEPAPGGGRDRSGASPVVLPMLDADLPAVAEVERRCFAAPWGVDVLREELHREWGHVRVLRPAAGQPIVAFLCFWIVHDEVHVLVVATDPEHRGRGYARRLLQDMIAFVGRRPVRYAILEVRRSNTDALRLYDGLGFQRVGVRPRYYADNDEDAIVMMLTLPEGEGG